MTLTERQKRILKAIVKEYIDKAEPISSRRISKKKYINYSPATIRNEMLDLEEMGFLNQPHTSAGRIPTNKAYRFYIENLMELERLSREEEEKIKAIKKEYAQKKQKIRNILKKASLVLTSITNLSSFSVTPSFDSVHFQRLEMVKLDDFNILLLLLTKEGFFENVIVKIDKVVSQKELDRISKKLNSKIKGFKLEDVKYEIENIINVKEDEITQKIITTLKDVLMSISNNREIYIEGTSRLVELPEFSDPQRLKVILNLIDNKNKLIEILNCCIINEGLKVLVGLDNIDNAFNELSIVVAPYRIGKSCFGNIGILGPTRISYSKIVNAVNRLSKEITTLLENL